MVPESDNVVLYWELYTYVIRAHEMVFRLISLEIRLYKMLDVVICMYDVDVSFLILLSFIFLEKKKI